MTQTRNRWLTAGVEAIAEEGANGVRIDRLAARLGLSKGSFHHHFDGADGFKRDLLDHLESVLINALHAAVAASPPAAGGHDKLARLTSLLASPAGALYQPELEVALRAWAMTDPEAARVQANVDSARLEVLRSIWQPLTSGGEQSRIAALLPYLISVGASVVVPPVSPEDLRLVFEMLLPLVPDDPRAPDDEGAGGAD